MNKQPADQWWSINGQVLLDALNKAHDGDDPDVVYSHKTDEVTTAPVDMPLTFYSRFGDLPFAVPCSLFAVLVLILALKPLLHRRRVG